MSKHLLKDKAADDKTLNQMLFLFNKQQFLARKSRFAETNIH